MVYVFGYFFRWYQISYIFCSIPILAILAFFNSPESPVFLIANSKEKAAIEAVQKLYGTSYDYLSEIDQIRLGLQEREVKNAEKPNLLRKFKQPEISKPFMIILLMGVIQQFSGMTVLRAYIVKIFNSIFQTESSQNRQIQSDLECENQIAREAYLAAVVMGIMRLVASLLLSKLLFHFRRRQMYLTSGKYCNVLMQCGQEVRNILSDETLFQKIMMYRLV